ncbi:MAG: hypothetical protein EXR72_24235 [Myxococcales bacterium]|nr:hypothetical protein [Myxococcales bacterium]
MQARLDLDRERITDFCCRWKIRELALFGSVLRDDFRDDSDVDVLVAFDDDARVGEVIPRCESASDPGPTTTTTTTTTK